jgi:hypothetical protein
MLLRVFACCLMFVYIHCSYTYKLVVYKILLEHTGFFMSIDVLVGVQDFEPLQLLFILLYKRYYSDIEDFLCQLMYW